LEEVEVSSRCRQNLAMDSRLGRAGLAGKNNYYLYTTIALFVFFYSNNC
jgi:hypothetical protein